MKKLFRYLNVNILKISINPKTSVNMLAQDLQPGQSFKRQGHNSNNFRTVAIVRDLDKVPNSTTVMRGKLEVQCTNGDSFWIYKTDRVQLQTPNNQLI